MGSYKGRAEERRRQKLAQKTLSVQQALDLGLRHHGAGRLSEAENIYQEILKTHPNQPIALQLLGVIALQMGKNGIAVELISKAIAIEPDFAEAHNNLGTALKELGRLDEAVNSFHQAVAVNPDYAGAYNNLGIALKDQGKLEEAVDSYSKALVIEPAYVSAHGNLGNALQEQGLLEAAVTSFRKALAIKPDYVEAHCNLGNALQEQGRLDEAVARYREALAIKPDYAGAYNNLGIALKEQGKLEEAETGYRKALAIKPDYVEVHGNLGNALREQGKQDEAMDSYRRALAIDDGYADAHKGLGMSLHFKGRLTEAECSYLAGIALNPDPDMAHVGLRRIRIDRRELCAPAIDIPDEQRENEESHPGLRTWNRPAEKSLREILYSLAVTRPEEEASSGYSKDQYSAGIRQGNMYFSNDYKLLELNNPAIKKLKYDITQSVSSLLNSDILIFDSFFNIYHSGSIVNPHNHINRTDKSLGLSPQKFSLTYYVDAGDKSADEPGILKLYNPDIAINPQNGDVVLFPSSSNHSTSYSGTTDRIMIGINLYTI